MGTSGGSCHGIEAVLACSCGLLPSRPSVAEWAVMPFFFSFFFFPSIFMIHFSPLSLCHVGVCDYTGRGLLKRDYLHLIAPAWPTRGTSTTRRPSIKLEFPMNCSHGTSTSGASSMYGVPGCCSLYSVLPPARIGWYQVHGTIRPGTTETRMLLNQLRTSWTAARGGFMTAFLCICARLRCQLTKKKKEGQDMTFRFLTGRHRATVKEHRNEALFHRQLLLFWQSLLPPSPRKRCGNLFSDSRAVRRGHTVLPLGGHGYHITAGGSLQKVLARPGPLEVEESTSNLLSHLG